METDTKIKILSETQSLQDSHIKLKMAYDLISQVSLSDRFLDARLYNVLVLINDINSGVDDRLGFLKDQLTK